MMKHKLLAALAALALTACGSSDSQPCKAVLTATFETVPNGALPAQLVLGGISLTPASVGVVSVLRDMPDPAHTVPALYLASQGRVIALPGCDAHSVELVFNDTQGPIIISIFGAETGGGIGQDGGAAPDSLEVSSRSTTSFPDAANPTYRRAIIQLASGGKIRRLELLGTGDDAGGTTGGLVRLITFNP